MKKPRKLRNITNDGTCRPTSRRQLIFHYAYRWFGDKYDIDSKADLMENIGTLNKSMEITLTNVVKIMKNRLTKRFRNFLNRDSQY